MNYDLHPINNYRKYYYILGPAGFVLSLLAGILEIPYVLLFFGVTANLIFSFRLPTYDPEHSSVTHFEYSSRMSLFNIGVGLLIALTALLFTFTPFSRPLTVFILWSAAAFFLPKFADQFGEEQIIELIVDYIAAQMPQASPREITKLVLMLLNSQPTMESLVAASTLDEADTKRVQGYFEIYMENNLS